MAFHAHRFEKDAVPLTNGLRVYTVCFFDPGQFVPRVKLLDALTDEEAIAEARTMNPWTKRELWERHRFVATIQSKTMDRDLATSRPCHQGMVEI